MSIWRSLRTVEELNGNRAGTLIENLGILFTEIGDDFVRATMPVDARTVQPYGLLHGGASVALAETLGSMRGAQRPRDRNGASRASGWPHACVVDRDRQ